MSLSVNVARLPDTALTKPGRPLDTLGSWNVAGQAQLAAIFPATPNDYTAYELDLSAIQTANQDGANGSILRAQITLDGTTWRNDAFYRWTLGSFIGSSSSAIGTASAGAGYADTAATFVGGMAGVTFFDGRIRFPDLVSTDPKRTWFGDFAAILLDGVLRCGTLGANYYGAAGAVRGVRIFWQGGENFANGHATLYGLRSQVGE